MGKFDALLDLQNIDLKRSQIAHGIQNLPQRLELTDVEEQSAKLDPEVNSLRSQLEVLATSQQSHEKEIARLTQKANADNERLYNGSIASPKEATALSHEIETLQEHVRTEEDAVLELMEQSEPLQTQLDELLTRQSVLATQIATFLQQIAEAETEAAVTDDAEAAKRNELVATICDDLVALYEKHRKNASGQIAVGVLDAGTCSACNLSLAAGERERIQALDVDEPTQCPECGALLLRASSKES